MPSEITELNFIANARLKDIVGRGLIYNDNIALIELIKNAKDADSPRVELTFSNANKEGIESQIIIRDFGKGMSLKDIETKWLNIAYSAKKYERKEDGKAYAGNKGVGRFSCDRLGKKLDLYTIQDDIEGYYLSINWKDYEVDDPNITISDKKIPIYTKTKEELKEVFGTTGFTRGTVLVISDLRNTWEFNKLDKLKKELEKFVVCPTDQMSIGDFDVFINTNYLDSKSQEAIDGKVENKIFSELEFRTTSIESSISADGKVIETTLRHDGNNIFTVTEKSPYSKLKNIKSKLYYLNQPSKTFFTKKTGYKHLDYGSVLLFLNGFRVFPYGEPGDDWLDLDKRKAQGYNRNLGTRELVGYASIEDSEDTFVPVSAREGLVVNDAFLQLKDIYEVKGINQPGFISKALRKLEKFVVEGLDWDRVPGAKKTETFEGINPSEIKFRDRDEEILNVLSSVIYLGIKKEDIIDVKVYPEYLQQLAQKEKDSFKKFCTEVKSKIKDGNSIGLAENLTDILRIIEKQEKQLKYKEELNKQLSGENIELEQEVIQSKEVIKRKEKEVQQSKEIIKKKEKEVEEKAQEVEKHKEIAKQKEDENLFLRATTNKDTNDLMNLMHKIIDDVDTIRKAISNCWKLKNKNLLNPEFLDSSIEKIMFKANSILKVAEFATYRNYKMKTGLTNIDLIKYTKDYLNLLIEENIHTDINIIDKINPDFSYIREITPINISMLIDNVISNSKKAKAKNLVVQCNRDKDYLSIAFNDDGNGCNSDINQEEIFNKGFTTTINGSGLGLFHIKDIVENDLKGTVKAIFGGNTKGFILEVNIPCN